MTASKLFLFLRPGPQAKKNLCAFGKRPGRRFLVRELGELLDNQSVDRLPVLAGIYLDALALTLEELNGRKRLRLEGVESRFMLSTLSSLLPEYFARPRMRCSSTG